jgi:hypothetical protein
MLGRNRLQRAGEIQQPKKEGFVRGMIHFYGNVLKGAKEKLKKSDNEMESPVD